MLLCLKLLKTSARFPDSLLLNGLFTCQQEPPGFINAFLVGYGN